MRVTAKVPTLLNTLLLKTSANYHMGDLMEFKYERGVALHIPAYHLYIDYTIKQKKIIERELVFFIIDTSQTKVKKDDFNALIEFAHSKINTFQNFQSISSILTRMYIEEYKDRQISRNFAKKGFEILKRTSKSYSYYCMRFFIAIERLVGLDKFSDEDYFLIRFDTFKPLFISFALELLWKNNLQHRLITEKLMQQFILFEKFIPFSDIHHLIYAKKQIKDERFRNIIARLQDKMSNNLSKQMKQTETNIDFEVVEEMKESFMNDLYSKYL